MKYNLLILDDEIEKRKEVYIEVFSNDYFELRFIDKFDILEIEKNIDSPDTHGIIIDMFLENWQKGKEYELFQRILKYIGHKKPIILISRFFQQIASWIEGNSVESNEIILFFGWEEICNDKGDVKSAITPQFFSSRTAHSLKKYYHRTNSLKDLNEKITLLVISDLQFGDPKFNEDTIIAARQLGSELTSKFSIKPDFLVITGDIAYSGLPSQFKLANDWINTLCKYIFPTSFTNYSERVLIVPGNHDANLTLSASDYYEYNFTPLPDKNRPEKLTYLNYREAALQEHFNYGLMPFCEFAYKITRNSHWIHQVNNLCWVNDQFLDWGIRFIHLNSVSELDYESPEEVSIKTENLQSLIDSIKLSENDDIMTVILSHNGPEDFGFTRGEEIPPRCSALFTLINTVKADLFLLGHRHKGYKGYNAEYEGDYTEKIKYIMSGTLSLNKLAKDTLRSFSVIEFVRNNGYVESANHKIFELKEGSIRLEKDYPLNLK